MSAVHSDDATHGAAEGGDQVVALIPMVRRIVGARVADRAAAEDIVQETLARVLAAVGRIEPGMLEPYAIVTARNVVATMWRDRDRQQRNQHRVMDIHRSADPDEDLLAAEERAAVTAALARLPERERNTLVAHEVSGEKTRALAAELGSTPGAVAAQLNRTRARLRVEYLLAMEGVEPESHRCRTVMLAISSGDRRRQRDVDADRHLLECALCARLGQPLMDRGQDRDDEARIWITADADVVVARRAVRELAGRAGFRGTDPTVIATAVSEIARNIVRFAGSGEIVLEALAEPQAGIRITAHDTGPGIVDVEQAMADGYSTNQGLGLGLPGARRLMDEFELTSQVGRGTTVTMTKWNRSREG